MHLVQVQWVSNANNYMKWGGGKLQAVVMYKYGMCLYQYL